MSEQRTPNSELPKTAEALGAALSPKHRQFADEYLSNGLNARAAGRTVGYRNETEGPRLTRRPDVAAYIQARLDEAGFTKGEITRRLEYFAAGDMRDFLTVAETERSYWVRAEEHPAVQKHAREQRLNPEELEDFTLQELFGPDAVATTYDGGRMVRVTSVTAQVEIDWRGAEKAQALGRVKKIKVDKTSGAVEFELHDPTRALELLGRAQKMFTDRTEHSGAVDLGVKYIAGLSEDDL